MMKRREFVAALGGAAAWPLAARAQRPGLPVIALLMQIAPSTWDFTGFRQGLKDTCLGAVRTLGRTSAFRREAS
jgi:putative ABC transport system substrate-binding protein